MWSGRVVCDAASWPHPDGVQAVTPHNPHTAPRLQDEIVGAHFEAEQLVDFVVLGCQKDHRQFFIFIKNSEKMHSLNK